MLDETAASPTACDAPSNHFDKYGSSNPIARRLMRGFLDDFDRFVARSGATDAYEIGCGEGHLFLRLLVAGLRMCGSDLAQWGNTLDHVQHWSTGGYADLLSRRFDVVEVATPLPWTMALCPARGPGA